MRSIRQQPSQPGVQVLFAKRTPVASNRPRSKARLCRIAGAFDRGLFEATGVRFSNATWTEGAEGCCRIDLADAES